MQGTQHCLIWSHKRIKKKKKSHKRGKLKENPNPWVTSSLEDRLYEVKQKCRFPSTSKAATAIQQAKIYSRPLVYTTVASIK